MSTSSTAFDWKAPVPQVFTRAAGPTFWPGDRRYRPLDWSFRRLRDLAFLVASLPPELRVLVRERFKPARGALRWETPPALPVNVRQPYAQTQLTDGTADFIGAEIMLTANFIERLLEAPEGMVAHRYRVLE